MAFVGQENKSCQLLVDVDPGGYVVRDLFSDEPSLRYLLRTHPSMFSFYCFVFTVSNYWNSVGFFVVVNLLIKIIIIIIKIIIIIRVIVIIVITTIKIKIKIKK